MKYQKQEEKMKKEVLIATLAAIVFASGCAGMHPMDRAAFQGAGLGAGISLMTTRDPRIALGGALVGAVAGSIVGALGMAGSG